MHVRTSCQTVCVFHCQRNCINVQEGLEPQMKLKKSTFQVSKHLLTLQNKISHGQRTKERRRKSYYSGKKKKHTIKTQYMVNSEGTILLHKTRHDRGRIHDYEIFKNKHPTTPLQVENVLDLGYLGVQNDFPTVKSVCASI